MVFKLPKMTKREITNLIADGMICRIAFKGGKYPYIAPFQYVYLNGTLYFHFTNYGRKMKLLKKDNQVCVAIEKLQPDLREFHFVSLRGDLHVVEDPEERGQVIRTMSGDGRRNLSPQFLAAHGFQESEDWSSFTPDKPLIIVRLDIREELGLKSP